MLAESDTASRLIRSLRELADRHGFLVHAYCVMPDHLHFLIEGRSGTSTLIEFVTRYKQRTTHEFGGQLRGRLWQRYFYDHIVRREEDLGAIAWYIWMNPVRKQLAATSEEYAWWGSFTLEWKRHPRPAKGWVPPWKSDRAS